MTPAHGNILEQVQDDVKAAMKAGEKDKVADDEVAALQRERKRRLDAAEALREGGRDDAAGAEEDEAKLIEGYLPAQLSDEELEELVAAAVVEAGASEPKDMGNVMRALMPQVGGRADGKRVSGAVKQKLGA